MKIAYLSLGSNIGKREDYLKQAMALLAESGSIIITKASSFYETEPVGYENQRDFINNVLEIKTTLSPHDLLHLCLEIELTLKRKRIIKGGPRTIDIDLLLYQDVTLSEENLTIPHPRMWERDFVMKPLIELEPDPALLKTKDK